MEGFGHVMYADFHDSIDGTIDIVMYENVLYLPPEDQWHKKFYTLMTSKKEEPNAEFFETAEKNSIAEYCVIHFLLAQFDEKYKNDKYAFVPVRSETCMHNFVIFTLYLTVVEASRRHKTSTGVMMSNKFIPGKLTVAFEKTEEFYNILIEVGIMNYFDWIHFEFNRLLEPFQVYHNLCQSKRSERECKVQCLVHALKECGVSENVCHDIANFTDNKRYIGVDVYTDVAERFNLKIRLQYYDGNGNLKIGNSKNGGWYGRIQNKDTITCELAIIEDHVIANHQIPISKFYIKNSFKVIAYGFMHGWTPQQCFQATKFVGDKCYTDKTKTTPALFIIKEMLNDSIPEERKKSLIILRQYSAYTRK